MRWIPPIVVSITLLLEPVLGTLIGLAWTGEAELGPFTILGGALMISGAIIVTLQEALQTDQ